MDSKKFQYSNYRSGELVNGIDRAAHRSLLYCTGLDQDDLHRPLIAVVNSFTEMVPGHIGLRELADYVKQGIWQAGGVPREFSTIALCDGICQGHDGMRYPLPSRENIADAIEMMVEAHHLDGMVMLPGCDKIVPGMIMAAARCDIPTIIIPAGPMLAGHYKGRTNITLTDMREFIGQTEVGKMSEEDLLALEQRALPTYGTCAMLGTANSMSFLSEILGLALPHSTTAPAVSSEKRRYAKEAGKRILGLIQENLTARKILTRKNLLNGIRAVMAMGASTNTVLHLMAIAHEAQVELSLDDFDRISREIPYLCNLKPSGEYPMEAFHEAGGVQTVLKALETKLDLDQLTVTGKTLGANLKEVSFADGPVIHSLDHPKKPEGGIAILYGNLAPKGAVVKKAGVKPSMYQFTGTARVFNYMEDACRAIQAGEIPAGTVIVLRYEGPKGGPGMREQHMVTSLLVGRGMDESCALITDGRFSGSTRGPAIGHISPEAAAGGPIATVQDGDTITIDIPGRKLTLHLSAEEIQKRLAQVQLLRKPATPALQKYAALVTSADRGAILEIPECLK
ncbi:dihydroxy-acid dehydratase [Acidaminococcus fermentans]|uniref:dihydroxy-acid dehydratase n=1 Tax=Acidaminococcus fermentans TaxID=905 RepID=UPI0008E8710C|nr:dihydroxy-acid dehydratase [Acidaminococcus fermentans]MEE0339147.1 dihydroxy-acid dehydratase [Acidaminococcus fermentans]SFO60661.1 dihydroxy-acid dehydratase [Acidaminococcus fermentans]